jgi:hypothetical protein
MEEGHELPFRAAARITVKHSKAERSHLHELRVEIIDFIADVMESLAAFFQKAPHRGVLAHGFQKFDAGIPDRQERNGYALIRHLFATVGFEA